MRQDGTAELRPHIDVTRLGFSEPPPCWALIEPDQTVSRHVEVLVPNEATIYTVDSLESVDQVSHGKLFVLFTWADRTPAPPPQRLSRGPFSRLAVSPNGKWLALLTAIGLLWVVSADFQISLAEYDTTAEGLGSALQLVWCGNDAIVLVFDGLVVIVGPHGQTLRYVFAFFYMPKLLIQGSQIPLCFVPLRGWRNGRRSCR